MKKVSWFMEQMRFMLKEAKNVIYKFQKNTTRYNRHYISVIMLENTFL